MTKGIEEATSRLKSYGIDTPLNELLSRSVFCDYGFDACIYAKITGFSTVANDDGHLELMIEPSSHRGDTVRSVVLHEVREGTHGPVIHGMTRSEHLEDGCWRTSGRQSCVITII